MPQSSPKVIVIQDGGRLHYAIPIALHRAGMLQRMYTDYYVKKGSPAALAAWAVSKVKPQIARRMMARRSEDLPDSKVRSNLLMTTRHARQRKTFQTSESFWEANARDMSGWVLRKGFGEATALMGFIRNIHPMLCQAAREKGLRVVSDQIIAPMAVEQMESRVQQERFAGWQKEDDSEGWPIMQQLEMETWPLSDHITCASDYVREGLVSQGIAAERITVLPYPIDASHFPLVDRAGRAGPVTVGFVGAVGLRKGAPYFFEVAKKLAGMDLRFVMVGGSSLKPEILAEKKGAVEAVGAVPRPEVLEWLSRFDILLFPSTCEGSAGSVMEAMATGLPIVTSPNSGSVVHDGVDGFIRAYDDVEAMAGCVERLVKDAELRRNMGLAARARAEAFNLDWYSQGLGKVFAV